MKKPHRGAIVGVSLAIMAGTGWAERLYYRYQNADGATVQTDRLSPDAAALGYTVVNASGYVIETVPRELTDEEREARDRARREEMLLEQQAIRRKQRDKALLLRYGNIDDIEVAKVRALKEFETRIGILRGSQMSLKHRMESEQQRAADFHRQGREMPAELVESLASLEADIQYAENAIEALAQESIETERQYDSDKQRLKELTSQASN